LLGGLFALCLAPRPGAAQVETAGVLCARIRARAGELLRGGHAVDTHLLAESLGPLCAGTDSAGPLLALDAQALVALDEGPRARQNLALLARRPGFRLIAAELVAWSYWRTGDLGGFAATLATMPPPARQRLSQLPAFPALDARALASLPAPSRDALQLLAARDRARSRRKPWLAGTLSALLPGLGQLYTGAPDAAFLSLALNALFIGAAVELWSHDLELTAVTAGSLGSIVYLGNVLNAVDLARRHDERQRAPIRAELERLLIPTLRP
jgi:hypothetical protein